MSTITFNNIDNINLDGRQDLTLSQLSANTTYKIRATVTNQSNNKTVTTYLKTADGSQDLQFTTPILEVIDLSYEFLSREQTRVEFRTFAFNSSRTVDAYDIFITIWRVELNGQRTHIKSTTISNQSNSTYGSRTTVFTGLHKNTMYQITSSYRHIESGRFYRTADGETSYKYLGTITTKDYEIESTASVTNTSPTTITIDFTKLCDNTVTNIDYSFTTHKFASAIFTATSSGVTVNYPISSTFNFITATNTTNLTIPFTGLQPSTVYTFSGTFTSSRGLYTNLSHTVDLAPVETPSYEIYPRVTNLEKNSDSFKFKLSQLYDNVQSSTFNSFQLYSFHNGTFVSSSINYTNVPSHTLFRDFQYEIFGLNPQTQYTIKALITTNQYSNIGVDVFTDTTLSLSDDPLIATITAADVIPDETTVEFDIVDFQSEYSDGHTIILEAVLV